MGIELHDKTVPSDKDVLITLRTVLYHVGPEIFTEIMSGREIRDLCIRHHIEILRDKSVIVGFKQKLPRF